MARFVRRPLNGAVSRKGKRPAHDVVQVATASIQTTAASDASAASTALVNITGGSAETIKSLDDRVTALENIP